MFGDKRGKRTDRADNEDPRGVDRTVMTTTGQMLTQNDISALNQSDNQLVHQNLSRRTASFEASLPPRRNSNHEVDPTVPVHAPSPLMVELKQAIDQDS